MFPRSHICLTKIFTILGLVTATVCVTLPSLAQETVGALPQATYAEETLKSEDAYQKQITALREAVDSLEKRVNEARQLPVPPSEDDIKGYADELSLAEQQLAALTSLDASTIARLQATEIRGRLDKIRDSITIMRQRLGSASMIFGLDFFESAPVLPSSDQWSVPKNYRIRVNDQIRVLVLSELGDQNEYISTVDADGDIIIPGAGIVSSAGKTLTQLKETIDREMAAKFKHLSVEVTVVKLSNIQVQVSGAVKRPGTYILGGMATVLNGLHQAGGPTETGTLRRISLVRKDEPAQTIDLYDFFLTGNRTQDVTLQDGDLIFVPPVGSTASIVGEVIRPGTYEPDFPLQMSGLIELAGGVKPGGYGKNIQVERIVDNQYRIVINEPLGSKKFELEPGDVVLISSVQPLLTNKVEIIGRVTVPGMYGLTDGMRISDLVKLAQGLTQDQEVYLGRADILRIDPFKGTELITFNLEKALSGDVFNDIELKKFDRVYVYDPDEIMFRPRVVTVNGAVARPGTQNRNEGMRVRDLVAVAGGVLPQAHLTRANIIRYKENNETELIGIDLQKALSGDPVDNILLTDRDELTVFTIDEVRWQKRIVRIEGAVQRPGEYSRAENMRVSDLIFMSGGLTPDAGSTAEIAGRGIPGENEVIEINLETLASGGPDDVPLKDGDLITVQSVNPSRQEAKIVYISGEVARPGPYALKSRTEKLSDIIERAGGLTELADPVGMVFLRDKDNLHNEKQKADTEKILENSKIFAEREFQLQLAQLGLTDVSLAETSEQTSKFSNTVGGRIASEVAEAEIMDKDYANKQEIREKVRIISGSTSISVNLDNALKSPGSSDNIILMDGDRIYIQKINNTVSVAGAVMQPRTFTYAEGRSIDYYLEKSGGYSPDASKSNVIVIRSNGDAVPKNKVSYIQSGDIIVVPSKGLVDIASKWEKAGNITSVLADILSTAFIITKL